MFPPFDIPLKPAAAAPGGLHSRSSGGCTSTVPVSGKKASRGPALHSRPRRHHARAAPHLMPIGDWPALPRALRPGRPRVQGGRFLGQLPLSYASPTRMQTSSCEGDPFAWLLFEREVQAATARGVPVPRHDGVPIPDPELLRGARNPPGIFDDFPNFGHQR